MTSTPTSSEDQRPSSVELATQPKEGDADKEPTQRPTLTDDWFHSNEFVETTKSTEESMEAEYLESPSSPERCEEESPAQASFTSQMAETERRFTCSRTTEH